MSQNTDINRMYTIVLIVNSFHEHGGMYTNILMAWNPVVRTTNIFRVRSLMHVK